jgi:phosphopantothenoylcysteine decarboxylase/phosphopantothenate--cysteine ligase
MHLMRILITAGPTREYFDSVRFISNPSSGKMGYAIAAEAARRGHEVVLISGPVTLPEPEGVKVIHVVTAKEMFHAAVREFPQCHCAVMAAAVCDYRPAKTLARKLKKRSRPWTVRLQPTEDILAHCGRIKRKQVLIGFAMEDHSARKNAEAKLRRKRCDAMVLNGLSNVGTDQAGVTILRAGSGWGRPLRGSKAKIAAAILETVESIAGGAREKVPARRVRGL